MQTDIPLKALTKACAPDLLPLLGAPDAQVVAVETLELPAAASALDTVLRLRNPTGIEYLHLVEWQGYRDPNFLFRVLGYLAWLGQNRAERPIAITLVYLHSSDDVGATLIQMVEGRIDWTITFRCVRLWEQDAVEAVASGRPGLAVLSPLMRGATSALIEQAAALVLEQTTADPRQADLLNILGIFAEPLMEMQRFVQMVGRERLMASELLNYLMAEQMAELERERTAQVQTLIEAIEEAAISRFPQMPIARMHDIRQVRDAERLRPLLLAVLRAPDQAAAEAALRAAVTQG